VPVLRWAARPDRAHLPAREWLPPLISESALAEGELHLLGRLTEASNATWLTRLGDPEAGPLVVYKPVRGERPLWDFPDGTLAERERAAYLVSELGGWHLVPPTILREGPAGLGMAQAWVGDVDDAAESVVHVIRVGSDARGLRPVLRASDDTGAPLLVAHEEASDVRALALLDCVLNNTDRKGAHAFRHAGQLYAVDHGVTFHAEPKLRTVLWGWGGEAMAGDEIEQLRGLREQVIGDDPRAEEVRSHLTAREMRALLGRIDDLLRDGRFPEPDGEWPAIPWPPI